MDLDIMWMEFNRYRPMLNEMMDAYNTRRAAEEAEAEAEAKAEAVAEEKGGEEEDDAEEEHASRPSIQRGAPPPSTSHTASRTNHTPSRRG